MDIKLRLRHSPILEAGVITYAKNPVQRAKINNSLLISDILMQ
jgi:hypothetical protein